MDPDLMEPVGSLLGHFERAVAEAADAVALWYFDRELSFGEVSARSWSLARGLHDRGVGPGDRVAVLGQNTPVTVIVHVAVWRLGGVVVPLNPMLTARELGFQLTDSGSKIVIVEADRAPEMEQAVAGTEVESVLVSFAAELLGDDVAEVVRGAATRVDLPSGWELVGPLLRPADHQPGPTRIPAPDDIALLTYTSGTTGVPKAATNTHANAAFSAEVYRSWQRLGPGDVILGAAPLFHITGLIAHIGTAFVSRCPLVLGYRFEPATILRLIDLHRCTTTVAAITAYISLMDHPEFGRARLDGFDKLFSGGAPVAPGVVARWEDLTGTYIHNAYGLTETTSPSHLVPLGTRAPVDELTGALSVGVPVPSTYCRVVDVDSGEDVPPGEVGELLTAGPQVVPGYWRRPEQNLECFVDGRWLRTGDIARADTEGWHYVVDRAKDMIVASGFKVWPREVEDVFATHPAVSEAAVVGVEDPYRGEAPIAFVVPVPGAEVTAAELESHARANLAAYKIPRKIEVVTALPKTATGKILRRELRETGPA
jgi:long-chain acyl-CoA synthetase